MGVPVVEATGQPQDLGGSKAASVYRRTRLVSGVAVVCESAVKSWDGWPDEARDTLRLWNRQKRLSFVGIDTIGRIPPQPTFKCVDCERFVNPSGSSACRLDGALICDDCIILRALTQPSLTAPNSVRGCG